ncbi:hypothetical protein ACSBR2_014293 [Camellia fascicularis]
MKLHEVMATKSKIYFAMEYLCGSELFQKVSQGRLKEDSARNFFKQLVCAVDFCHSRGVYHRDLILDENGNLKVTDFELSAFSKNLKHDKLLHTACGTPVYVASEVIEKKGYDGANESERKGKLAIEVEMFVVTTALYSGGGEEGRQRHL